MGKTESFGCELLPLAGYEREILPHPDRAIDFKGRKSFTGGGEETRAYGS